MKSNPLMADETLFRDRTLFEITHLPEVFNYRDAQLKDLAFALRPTFYGSRPLNVVLRGIPGTGKTTAVRRIFAEVEETTNQVVPVLVSCQSEKTLFAVLRHIFHVIFGYSPPTAGVSNERLLSEIAQALIERKAVLVVCLDDANWLLPNSMLDIVLGPLLRMHEVWPTVHTGVFLTLSSPETDLSRALDPATRSVLQASEVFFPPYTADEVRGILADRVRAGLYPGVMPPAVLDLVVERVMATADLRVGLDLIERSTLTAETAARTSVTTEDVHTAFAVSRHLSLSTAVQTLSAPERTVLEAIVAEAREGGPVVSGRVYDRVCREKEMCYTAFHDRLKRLEALRLVGLYVRQRKGRTREIVVADGVSDVVSAGSSGESMNGCIGVADDEKRRYETGRG